MDILDMARQSGMVVILEDNIGRERYQSVYGSLPALRRFVASVLGTAMSEADTGTIGSRIDEDLLPTVKQ